MRFRSPLPRATSRDAVRLGERREAIFVEPRGIARGNGSPSSPSAARNERERGPGGRGRAGFTLIEVVVALSLAALVLLGARAMLSQLADSAEATAKAAAEADRDANAERLLRDVVGRIETSPDAERGVWGGAQAVRFSTWCDVPDGWLERCTASLGVLQMDSANVLALELPHGEVHPVRRGFRRATLLYLADPGSGGRWVRNWSSTVTAPLAIGVVADADTLILRIGERG